MRKPSASLGFLLVVTLLVACVADPVFSFADIEGEWDFPDGAHVSVVATTMIDIAWTDGAVDYFTYSDGNLDGTRFEGTYTSVENDIETATNLTVTMTLSLQDGKLTVSCTGEGRLNGKTFSAATKVL